MNHHQLPSLRSLGALRRRIRADLIRVGASPALAFDCLVAVTEACTNALLHGRGDREDEPSPDVSWEIDSDSARFYIQDFSARQWSSSGAPRDSEDGRDPGGFGLELMRGLMDETDIRVGPEGTRVTLLKKLSGSARS